MTNTTPWNIYRQQRIEALQQQGYLVSTPTHDDHWLSVGAIGTPGTPGSPAASHAESYLAAEVKCFQEPSRYGIDEGRISKLSIARYERPTCRQLFLRSRPEPTELYNFDRGLDYDRLKDDDAARRFYQDLLDQLN